MIKKISIKTILIMSVCVQLTLLSLNIMVISQENKNTEVTQRSTIKGKIFVDSNKNGLDDDGITNVDYTTIFLNVLQFPGYTFAQFQIKKDGMYELNVYPGRYMLEFSFNNGYIPTIKGSLDTINDSDINMNGKSDYIDVTSENRIIIANAGIINNNAILGDKVWNDKNQNAKQDDNELGIEGVNIKAYKANTIELIQERKTDKNGKYNFSLPAGNYDFKFETPKGYIITKSKSAFNNNDSDIDMMGEIKNLGLFAGEVNNDYDAGYYQKVTEEWKIGDYIKNIFTKNIKQFMNFFDFFKKFLMNNLTT
jgi:serine-aspartate repeat-containing protein C/D/E